MSTLRITERPQNGTHRSWKVTLGRRIIGYVTEETSGMYAAHSRLWSTDPSRYVSVNSAAHSPWMSR